MTGNSIALDTNQAIAWLNGRPGMDLWITRFSNVYLPVIVIGELRFGALKSLRAGNNISKIESLISRCGILEVKENTAAVYARLRLGLMQKGRPIPENDLWIAAICVEHGVALASVDVHLKEVDGLQILVP